MIFSLSAKKDEYIEQLYDESMSDLNKFYEINWVHHLPKVIVIDDRDNINKLRGEMTESWLIAWAENRTVYILNRYNFEKESSHKFDPEEYKATFKHELSHLFYYALAGSSVKPVWLNEGFAIYTSGQNKFKKKPVEFSSFLEFYDHGGKDVYKESGFFVEMLLEKFGKEKLLNFVKNLRNTKNEHEFNEHFFNEFGFAASYEEINSRFFNLRC